MSGTADEKKPDEAIGPIPEAGFLGRMVDSGGQVFAIGIILSMLILLNEVILRYVFKSPTIWAHETTIFLCGIAFIYGGLYCTARDRHIRVVLIYDNLPASWKRVFDIAISLVCTLSCAMFSWAAWLMVERAAFTPDGSIRLERTGSAWDPPFRGMTKVFLFCVLTILAIQFLILAINHFRRKP